MRPGAAFEPSTGLVLRKSPARLKLEALEKENERLLREIEKKKRSCEVTEEAVLRQASAKLATFKTPKRIVFVDALPKNPSGKLLKRQLREAHSGLFAER